jgi:hypothetical protein
MPKKKTEPKFILVSCGQIDVTSGDGVTTFARAFQNKADAARWLQDDYNDEAGFHDWNNIQISENDIKDGKQFKSPADDPDHDYVWKVIFQY